jgi:hypothetical protein
MENDFINSAIDMMTPVMEGAMILAAQYAKACNRNTVTAMDMKYGMRYSAKNFAGKQIGTLFPELQGSDEDEDEDDSSIEEVDEDEEPFTRYSGNDEIMVGMNKAYDEWDEWEPFSPLEKMLKSAIDNSA